MGPCENACQPDGVPVVVGYADDEDEEDDEDDLDDDEDDEDDWTTSMMTRTKRMTRS